MPKVELYINNQLCDLRGDEEINADYAVFDISKIGSRGGARTYEFSLPKTNRNKTVLESAEIINNISLTPYTQLKARLLVDGVDVLMRFCQVSSVKDYYSIVLYGGNTDIYAVLKDKNLLSVDLAEYDHYWNFENIVGSRANTEGYIYPLVDYHVDSPNAFINNDNGVFAANFLMPAVFVNTVLQKIFEDTEFTFINEVESDTENLILACTKTPESNLDGRKYEGTLGLSTSFTVGPAPALSVPPVWDVAINYDYAYFPNSSLFLTINEPSTFDWRMSFQVTNLNALTTITLGVIVIDGAGSADNYYYVVPPSTTQTHVITYNLTEVLPAGYSIRMNFWDNAGGQLVITTNTEITILNVKLYEQSVTSYGEYISLSGTLPKMTQAEFLKAYMQMFCLMPIVNDAAKTFSLIKFSTILSKVSQAYDWSELIDLSENFELKYIIDSYGQNNLFEYKKDGEEEKPFGTDGKITINNGNLPFEKTPVTLPYAGTNTSIRFNDRVVNQIKIYEDGELSDTQLPRPLVLRKVTYPDSSSGDFITYTDSTNPALSEIVSTNLPFTYFINAAQVFNLGFGNNLIASYYELLSNILSGVKIVRVPVRLTAAMISQMDFTRPVYIRQYEAYFYISNINGFSYTNNKSTMVELVKLNING